MDNINRAVYSNKHNILNLILRKLNMTTAAMVPDKVNTIKNNGFDRCKATEDSILKKTVGLSVNLLTHILIVLIVIICVVFSYTWKENISWRSLTFYEWHIILCVLGFQLFMCQGTLVLSKYNSWSLYLNRRYKIHLHWIFQLIAVILVTVGSVIIMQDKVRNFETAHGTLGIIALITSLLGILNGLSAYYAYKVSSYINVTWNKFIHYVTGIGTLLLAAASLCYGFDIYSFRAWAGNINTNLLIIFTCVFTVLVAMDFFIATGKKIRNMF